MQRLECAETAEGVCKDKERSMQRLRRLEYYQTGRRQEGWRGTGERAEERLEYAVTAGTSTAEGVCRD